MAKLSLKGFIIVSKNDLENVLNELPNHINLTRKEAGCLIFDVKQDEDDIYKFHVYEEFKNKESFEFHQSRVSNSSWGKITKNAERNYEISAV
ncbi:MAG: putative quinol monooxygenase [Oleiphilus sp.]